MYLRWPERNLEALVPLVRLVWDTLLGEGRYIVLFIVGLPLVVVTTLYRTQTTAHGA